jgi:hypothetical protein
MKIKFLFFSMLLAISFTASGQKPSAKEKPVVSKLNPLELALDFDKGTKEVYTDFKEDGGLDKFNNWYGIQISGLTLQRGADGLVSGLIMNVNPYQTVTIKQLRATINAYCGLTNADWKNTEFESGSRYLAQASSTKCQTASYDNYVNGRGIWSITISKVKY